MDERILRELDLLPVARLYGLVAPAAPAQRVALQPTAAEPSAWLEPGDRAKRPTPIPAMGKSATEPVAGIESMGWSELRTVVAACSRCRLCEQRKQAVFGVGNESAPWLFVGEGPGAEEDEKGEPFVGQAGKLLDSMLAAVRLARGREVYIANVVKCRPPGNRVPSHDEAQACAAFLDRQIDLIAPKLIVALGKTAALRLTGSEGSVASQRGRLHRYRDIPLVITYHPAYLLRNLPDKAKAWEDLLFARRAMESGSTLRSLTP